MTKLSVSQFGVMSAMYQQYGLEYCMESVASNGFHYLDFWGGAGHYSAFDMPESRRRARVREIRSLMDSWGLEMSVFTAEQSCLYPINVASSNPFVRRNSVELVKRYIEDAREFGARYFFLQMGFPLFDEDIGEAFRRSVESLSVLAEYAEQIGVRMVMEQLQKYESGFCCNRNMLKKFIDAVGSPFLTVCVDCVAAAAAGETPEDYYRAFGTISHVHLADGRPTGHLCPGDGENPLTDYLRVFAEHGFDQSITLEINNQMYFDDPDQAAARAAQWLRECPAVE